MYKSIRNFSKRSFPTNTYWCVCSSRVNFPDFNYVFPEKYICNIKLIRELKMLLLYPCASLDQILTENVMQSIYLWHDLKELWAKKSSYETLFSNKTNICDILIFAMSQRATFLTCPYIYGIDHGRILWSSYRKCDLNPQPLNSVQTL